MIVAFLNIFKIMRNYFWNNWKKKMENKSDALAFAPVLVATGFFLLWWWKILGEMRIMNQMNDGQITQCKWIEYEENCFKLNHRLSIEHFSEWKHLLQHPKSKQIPFCVECNDKWWECVCLFSFFLFCCCCIQMQNRTTNQTFK